MVIDDAHTYESAAWEEIERLLAFKIDKRGAIELLLAGPPSLAQQIDSLRATLVAKEFDACALFPPSDQDLASYIDWRLARFEMADLITPDAAQMIARLSGGRYAAVDVLCQMSLLLLRQLGVDRVDTDVAKTGDSAARGAPERQARRRTRS